MVTLEVAARGGVRPGGAFLLGLWFLRSFFLALCWHLALVSMAGEFMMYSVSLMTPQLSSCWLLPLTWGLAWLLSAPAWVPALQPSAWGHFTPLQQTLEKTLETDHPWFPLCNLPGLGDHQGSSISHRSPGWLGSPNSSDFPFLNGLHHHFHLQQQIGVGVLLYMLLVTNKDMATALLCFEFSIQPNYHTFFSVTWDTVLCGQKSQTQRSWIEEAFHLPFCFVGYSPWLTHFLNEMIFLFPCS